MVPKRNSGRARAGRCAAAIFVLAALWTGVAQAKSKPKAADPQASDEALKAQLDGKTPKERADILKGIVDDGKASKEIYFQLGNARYESADVPGATTAFEQAVAMDSTYFKAVVNLGLMYDEASNYSKAIETFEEAGRLQPDSPDVWSHMGNTYYAQKEYSKATDLYRKALKLQPNAPHALYSLGVAFADAGIFREAVSYWKRVVELDPKSDLGKNAAENVQLLQKYLVP
jgi:tetratricopeptide (TPR) repeat protein